MVCNYETLYWKVSQSERLILSHYKGLSGFCNCLPHGEIFLRTYIVQCHNDSDIIWLWMLYEVYRENVCKVSKDEKLPPPWVNEVGIVSSLSRLCSERLVDLVFRQTLPLSDCQEVVGMPC